MYIKKNTSKKARFFSYLFSVAMSATVIGGLFAYTSLTTEQSDTIGDFLKKLPAIESRN
ncbi:MAG: hypothetical protein R3B69_01040 [Candidatus Paceibacterota bacterium]